MRNNFNFLSLTETIKGIITLPTESKEKKYPFIIVNTDNDRGLYIRKLELELAKYKGLQQAGRSSSGFHGIKTNDLIVFGDSLKYDYRIESSFEGNYLLYHRNNFISNFVLNLEDHNNK